MRHLKWVLLAMCCVPLAAYSFSGKRNLPAEKPKPLCFLSGDVKQYDQKAAGFDALSNVVRLRFDASDPADCESQLQVYCRTSILGNHYAVGKLAAYFSHETASGSQRVDYVLGSDCSVNRVSSPQ